MKNFLEVTKAEYEFYLECVLCPRYFPSGFNRLEFAIKVIENYVANPEGSLYEIEDLVFELRKAYLISIRDNFKLPEVTFSVKKIVSYVFTELGLNNPRIEGMDFKSELKLKEILQLMKNEYVSDPYVSKYK